ncbi:hypothetical protein C1H76_0978 [Elsinoe australis]|uniref:Uncharacterized protein n=1 Tax=Elsinoe australis TaxID=40998 RepID=A0A4U7B5Z3_9PEZI|nr:hypothetical protein C1H76_0978 [Elsinoe australis]
MPKSTFIVEDTSTIAYEDFVEQKKRPRSPDGTESATSGASFQYQPGRPAQPDYVCYPNPQYPPVQYPTYQCYPQQQAYMPQYAYAPQQFIPQPYSNQAYAAPGYQQYQCYPTAYDRFVAAGAPQPAPAPAAAPAIESTEKEDAASENFWIGRTRAQVDEDNIKIAAKENVFKYDAMKPAGAVADALFWVVELDGRTTLRMFKTIDEDLGPGKWERDHRHGNAYFVREKAEEEAKEVKD